MKVKIEHKTTEEVEVMLPAFFKSGSHFFKIISEQDYIIVKNGSVMWGIERYSLEAPAYAFGYTPCEEEEFNNAFDETLEKMMLWQTTPSM